MTRPIDEAELAQLVRDLQGAPQLENPSEAILRVAARLEELGLDLRGYALGRLKEAAQVVQSGWSALRGFETAGTAGTSAGAGTVQPSFKRLLDAIHEAVGHLEQDEKASAWLGHECSVLRQKSLQAVVRWLETIVGEGNAANACADWRSAAPVFALAIQVAGEAKGIGGDPNDLRRLQTEAERGLKESRTHNWFGLVPRQVKLMALSGVIMGALLLFFVGNALGRRATSWPAPNSTPSLTATVTAKTSPPKPATVILTPTPTATLTPTAMPTPTDTPITPSPIPTNTHTPMPATTVTPVPSKTPTLTRTKAPTPTPAPALAVSNLQVLKDLLRTEATPLYSAGQIQFSFQLLNTFETDMVFAYLGLRFDGPDPSGGWVPHPGTSFADVMEERRSPAHSERTFTVETTLEKGQYRAVISYTEQRAPGDWRLLLEYPLYFNLE